MYYELLLKDGESLMVKPQHVAQVQQDIDSGKDFTGGDRKIARSRIADFRPTDKKYVEESKLLEAGEWANPFAEESERGIKVIAVKKYVPIRKLDSYQKSGYTRLDTSDGYASVGFWLPSHQINGNVEVCTPEETRRLK